MNLCVKNLHVTIGKENILNGINLTIPSGEVHAIMGPNGSGKSTLAMVLAGSSNYNIKSGSILLNNKELIHMSPNERASEGLFLAFQNPIEIPGVNNAYFLRTIIKAHKKYNKMSIVDITSLIESYMLKLGISSDFLKRDVNDCFSGGEKKRNEIIQMMILEPKFSILDEIDSGLDIDALKFVSISIGSFLKKNPSSSILLVTHYSRLFKYIKPVKIHILIGGKIVTSGDMNLVKQLEIKGYQHIS
jgi:Fe-S cluster assembly ATP-binding protein